MRSKDRMAPFLKQVEEQWKRLPDWRFGQLMFNFFSAKGDPFYWEEDVFIKELEDFINENTKQVY